MDESPIASMLAKAESVIADVMREFKISDVLAAFSGGDDSIVSTHWCMGRFPDAVVMTADTKIGLEAARKHQETVCGNLQWQREVASPEVSGTPKGWIGEWREGATYYEEYCLNFGFPGPDQHRRMYQRLKQRAFRQVRERVGKRDRGTRIMVVSGIRQDESSVRAGYKRAYREEASERFVWVNPFYYCNAIDFETYRQEFGLPRNPVKRLCGISGECCCGAYAAIGERQAYRVVESAFADYLDRLELQVRQFFPWGWDQGPPKWWVERNRGQQFLFEDSFEGQAFMPACVGCNRKSRRATL